MAKNVSQLFLLEALFEELKLQIHEERNDSLDYTIIAKLGELAAFDIRADPGANLQEAESNEELILRLNLGKSCMFTSDPLYLAAIMQRVPIVLAVWQNIGIAEKPIFIGRAEVEFEDDAINMAMEAGQWVINDPLCEVMEDEFPLLDENDVEIGTIAAAIRLTCFGANVITKVNMLAGDKSRFQSGSGMIKDLVPIPIDRKIEDEKSQSANESNSTLSTGRKQEKEGAEKEGNKCPCDEIRKKKKEENKKKKSAKSVRKRKIQEKFFKRETNKPPSEVTKLTIRAKPNRRKSAYAPGRKINYPSYVKIHKCQFRPNLIPAKQGWAWKTAPPVDLQNSVMEGWRPGYYHTKYLTSFKKTPLIRPPPKRLEREAAQRKLNAVIRPPTLQLVRKSGEYKVTMNPLGHQPETYTYDADSADEDLELDLDMPFSLPHPHMPLKHQGTQFCDEDFEEKIKKKPKVSQDDIEHAPPNLLPNQKGDGKYKGGFKSRLPQGSKEKVNQPKDKQKRVTLPTSKTANIVHEKYPNKADDTRNKTERSQTAKKAITASETKKAEFLKNKTTAHSSLKTMNNKTDRMPKEVGKGSDLRKGQSEKLVTRKKDVQYVNDSNVRSNRNVAGQPKKNVSAPVLRNKKDEKTRGTTVQEAATKRKLGSNSNKLVKGALQSSKSIPDQLPHKSVPLHPWDDWIFKLKCRETPKNAVKYLEKSRKL